MLYLGAMMGFFFFTTQYLQGILGFTPLQAGLAFLPMSAVNFAVALLVTRAVRRFGSTAVLTAGRRLLSGSAAGAPPAADPPQQPHPDLAFCPALSTRPSPADDLDDVGTARSGESD